MKPSDFLAVASGTAAGAALAESAEQVVASAAAAVAVYLLRALISYLRKRFLK